MYEGMYSYDFACGISWGIVLVVGFAFLISRFGSGKRGWDGMAWMDMGAYCYLLETGMCFALFPLLLVWRDVYDIVVAVAEMMNEKFLRR